MRKIIGVLSGKGGTGKTTTVVNLGLAMHKLGENVVIVDGDLRNPNIGIHLGSIESYMTLHDILDREISLLEALHIHETGLRFIPAHLSLNYLNTDASKLKNILKHFDCTVLLDAPSGLDKGALAVLEAADESLIVTTPHLPDLTGCLKTIELARNMDVLIKGIVLNNICGHKHEISKKEIEAVSNTEVIHSIPCDKNIAMSIAAKMPVVERLPFSPASIAFFELASKLTGREYKKPRFLAMRRIAHKVLPKSHSFKNTEKA